MATPPNILIGSYANLTFGQFAINLSGICTICMIITAVYYAFWYKKDFLRAHVKYFPGWISWKC